MSFQGWKNYPTWSIGLWFENDQKLNEWKYQLIEEHANCKDLANAIKNTVEDICEYENMSDLSSDLLSYAVEEADYYQLASEWLDE